MAKQVIPTEMPSESLMTEPKVLGAVIKAKRTVIRVKLSDCATLCGIGLIHFHASKMVTLTARLALCFLS